MTDVPSSRASGATILTESAPTAPWTADRGDGTYRNPVLFADYSDPDVIRVGEDYWMTASSFCHAPGLPILHSRDLVNWSIVNHALPHLVPAAHFAKPRHGEGVWAPCIRHHAGKFWIFYPDPDFGLYVITTDDPRGAWSEPRLIKAGKGLIDPSPLWDDNGQAYLVHGWAKSRAGICNRLTLHRMDPESGQVLDEGVVIIDGENMPGWHTIEGPKFYKRNGWYYIFAPAGGVAVGYQAIFRARDIFGPYESRIVLEQGSSPVNGPHQGAWVETQRGEHWFFHFQELPAYGRVVHLQPMDWRDDDWPAMGVNRDAGGKGEPAVTHRKPGLPARPITQPATSDDFSALTLGHQWQWQGTPDTAWYSLDARPGALRLYAQPDQGTHWHTPHLLMQKFPALAFTASTTLHLQAAQENDRAGLIVFGYDYAWIGLRRRAGRTQLVFNRCFNANDGNPEEELASIDLGRSEVELRVDVDANARCRFSYRDADGFRPVGEPLAARSSKWVGAKVGLFATAGSASSGSYADFFGFRVGG